MSYLGDAYLILHVAGGGGTPSGGGAERHVRSLLGTLAELAEAEATLRARQATVRRHLAQLAVVLPLAHAVAARGAVACAVRARPARRLPTAVPPPHRRAAAGRSTPRSMMMSLSVEVRCVGWCGREFR